MSHFSTDRIIDDIQTDVCNMPMSKVKRLLIQRGKFDSTLTNDQLRDVLMDVLLDATPTIH